MTRGALLAGLVMLVLTLATPHLEAGQLPETNGAFYALSVQDLDTSVAWYTDHLGFTLQSRGENTTRKGALLSRPGTVLEIAEFAGAEHRPTGVESHEVIGIFKLGFTTEHIDDAFAWLSQDGVEVFFPVVTTPDGKRTFGVKDPDGNIVQFFEQ